MTGMREDELVGLAASVAAQLRHDHGIDSAPDAAQYKLEDASADGKARLLVDVDLGKGLVIPLEATPAGSASAGSDGEPLATRLSKYIAHLHEGEAEISATWRMIGRRIAKVDATGMRCKLISSTPIRLRVDRWERMFIEFYFEAIDDSLRLETKYFMLSDRKWAKYYFDNMDRSQAKKAACRAVLARYGADASIEAVLLNALRRAGIEDADLLHTLRGSRDRNISIIGADDTKFEVYWEDGVLHGEVLLGADVSWRKDSLFMKAAPRSFGKKDIGRRLVDIYGHELLEEGSFVRHAFGKKGRSVQLICNAFMHAVNLEEERFIDTP
jgi:hypothetical protein